MTNEERDEVIRELVQFSKITTETIKNLAEIVKTQNAMIASISRPQAVVLPSRKRFLGIF